MNIRPNIKKDLDQERHSINIQLRNLGDERRMADNAMPVLIAEANTRGLYSVWWPLNDGTWIHATSAKTNVTDTTLITVDALPEAATYNNDYIANG